MKKIKLFLLLISGISLQASLKEINDKSEENRFLGPEYSFCQSSKHDGQSGYDCDNKTASKLLNVNFLSPELLGQQFYMFNDFVYWLGKGIKQKAYDNFFEKEVNMTSKGIFMISIGTSQYTIEIVAPNKTCPEGQHILTAQLKYNDGEFVEVWSQDAICLAPSDYFSLRITNSQDDTVPISVNTTAMDADTVGLDWMKDPGPKASYAKANKSPRKIRLIK